jgi:hypothetical protein
MALHMAFGQFQRRSNVFPARVPTDAAASGQFLRDGNTGQQTQKETRQ